MREAPRAPGDPRYERKVPKREALQYNARRSRFPLAPGLTRSPTNSRFEGKISHNQRVVNDLALVQVESESQQAIWGRQKLPVGKICLVTYGGAHGNR